MPTIPEDAPHRTFSTADRFDWFESVRTSWWRRCTNPIKLMMELSGHSHQIPCGGFYCASHCAQSSNFRPARSWKRCLKSIFCCCYRCFVASAITHRRPCSANLVYGVPAYTTGVVRTYNTIKTQNLQRVCTCCTSCTATHAAGGGHPVCGSGWHFDYFTANCINCYD